MSRSVANTCSLCSDQQCQLLVSPSSSDPPSQPQLNNMSPVHYSLQISAYSELLQYIQNQTMTSAADTKTFLFLRREEF